MENPALTFQALSEEIRLRILALLIDTDELCVCDFTAVLQLPQSTVSRHLAHLKHAGWVRDRREGVWSYYALAHPLPTVHQALLPVLKNLLPKQDIARTDRKRLITCHEEGNCA